MEFAFTLKYQLSTKDTQQRDLMEVLVAKGFGDTLIRITPPGRLLLNFTRIARTADDALFAALKDVRQSLPTARLIEAGPDLVGLTDVAELVQVSRQNMRKLMLTHSASFPLPVHEGNASSVWHLVHVLNWLDSRGGYELDRRVIDVSRTAMHVNLARESRLLPVARGPMLQELLSSVAAAA